MMYCPYTQHDILAPFGVVSLVGDKDVLIKEDDEQHIVHFHNQNEATKFINDFYLSSLFYSMETEADFKIKTDENAKKMEELLNRRNVNKESIMLSRKIKIEGNRVNFIIGDESFELLDSNVALQSILPKVLVDGVINLSQRLWGKIDTEKLHFLYLQIKNQL